jgi:hypothetical protein
MIRIVTTTVIGAGQTSEVQMNVPDNVDRLLAIGIVNGNEDGTQTYTGFVGSRVSMSVNNVRIFQNVPGKYFSSQGVPGSPDGLVEVDTPVEKQNVAIQITGGSNSNGWLVIGVFECKSPQAN